MPITSVDEWSTTANLNSDVNGNSIAENCSPAGINNAMREMMAQIAATPLATSAAATRDSLDVPIYVATRTALKALDTTKDTVALLTESGREGTFIWLAGDYSTLITADTLEGVYVKATAIASTAGSWVRQRENLDVNVHWYGAVGDGTTNDKAACQQAIEFAMLWGSTCHFRSLSYKWSTVVSVASSSFRSFKLQGGGTGNHITAGFGCTTIVTNGTYGALIVTFNNSVNENFLMDGIVFYNQTPDYVTSGAVKIVRGASNGRYISGFEFKRVSSNGYAATFLFQGMNTTTFEDNYFGNTVFDQCNFYNGGVGIILSNATLNLVDFRSCLWFDNRYGGINLYADGDVGTGNGFGATIRASLTDCHMEGVAGMFRTQQATVLNSLSAVVRSVITLAGRFSHESCGATTLPTTGDPFVLGVDTDIIVTGAVDYGIAYGEDTLPYMREGCTLTSVSPIIAIANGGTFLNKDTICAPKIRLDCPVGTTTFTLVSGETSVPFNFETTLVLRDATSDAGYSYAIHRGNASGTTTTGVLSQSLFAGVTVTYGNGGASDALTVDVVNASAYAWVGTLTVENHSGHSITTLSVV